MNDNSQLTGWSPNDPIRVQLERAPGEPMPTEVGYKEGIGYGLWCLFAFGFAGIHRFYVGKYGTGLLWLLTWGLFGVGQILDLFRMKTFVREANIRDGYLPHPRYVQQLSPTPPSPALKGPSVRQTLLRTAQTNGGALTVTQGVAATGLDFEEIEAVLREMVAKGYVDVDNAPDSGVIVYRFPELSSRLS